MQIKKREVLLDVLFAVLYSTRFTVREAFLKTLRGPRFVTAQRKTMMMIINCTHNQSSMSTFIARLLFVLETSKEGRCSARVLSVLTAARSCSFSSQDTV